MTSQHPRDHMVSALTEAIAAAEVYKADREAKFAARRGAWKASTVGRRSTIVRFNTKMAELEKLIGRMRAAPQKV